MAIIKKISVFNGSSWSDDNIGADASNISLNSSVTLNQVLLDKLTGGKVLVTNGSGIINASEVGTDKLGYLSGVTGPIQTQLDGKVSNTGDTMTGALVVRRSGDQAIKYDVQNGDYELGTTVSEIRYGHELYIGDKNNKPMGMVRSVAQTDGGVSLQMAGYNRATTSSTVSSGSNALSLKVLHDGTQQVVMNAPTAWRTALGIQNTIQSAQSSSTVSLSAGTWKGLHSLTLTPGVYIIAAGCVIPSSVTSGTTAIHVGTANNSEGILNRAAQMNVPANAGSATTNLSVATVYRCTSNTTIYLNAYCATACTLGASASGLFAYKIIPN